jgi:hypothetical protein
VSDVERYAAIVGATPPVGPDGWFVGATEQQRAASRLTRYVTKVWAYRHPVPDDAHALRGMDTHAWARLVAEYEAMGGTAHLGTEGGTLFEVWVAHEVFERRRYSVLLSEAAGPLPIDGIPRVALLAPSRLADVLADLLPAGDAASHGAEREAVALMNLGSLGHVIRLRARSPSLDEIYFVDSWPGPSLLCDANNTVGLRAQLVQRVPVRWSLARAEFERTACALVVPTAALTWTRYGERLRPYVELKRTDLFERFRLREAAPFPVSEVLRVQPCTTRAEGHPVRVEFFLDEDAVVRLARVAGPPALATPPHVTLAPLIGQVARALEARAGAGPDQATVRAKILEAIKSGRPAIHAGDTLTTTIGVVSAEEVCAEILPA